MDILFASDDLRGACEDSKTARKRWGAKNAKKLRRRLDDLSAARNLEVARQLPGKCKELKGGRAGQLSMRLDEGYRLIFEPAADPPPVKPDGGLDRTATRRIRIVAVEDYHD